MLYERLSRPDNDEQIMESKWRARVAGPDTEVWRAFWTRKDEGLADEWMDVGGQHFLRGPDTWVHLPPLLGRWT